MFNKNNLQVLSNVNPQDLENAINKIKSNNGLKGLGKYFSTYETVYDVNAIIMAAIACLESAYGTSKLAKEKCNLFGLDAKDSLVGTDKYGSGYKTKSDSVKHAFHRIGKQYIELDPGCTWRYVGAKDIYSVGRKWCSKSDWADKVISIATRIENNIKNAGGSNMSKVFIGVGHGGSDPGAVSNGFKEADMNLVMAMACKDELVRHGVDVRVSRSRNENDPLSEEIRECNAFRPDLAIDCHNNSGGGDGFEVIHYSKGGTSKVLAQNIEREVVAIGQNSRGLKVRLNNSGKDYFGFIRETCCPAVICEGVFLDNRTDMQIADTTEKQKRFGVAYAKGILKTLGIPYKSGGNTSTNTSSTYNIGTYQKNVKITADVLNVRNGRGASFTKIGSFSQNQIVNVWYIDKASDGSLWGSCSCNGKTGYIHMGYTQPV